MVELNSVYNEDCLIGMQRIPDKSVDMILCDLPYGTTACKWDVIIPFEPLWKQYERVIKDNGAIVLTASQPFTTDLINSNREMFKYSWVWDKKQSGSFQLAKYRPLITTEDILIFSKGVCCYFPQMRIGRARFKGGHKTVNESMSGFVPCNSYLSETYYPNNILEFTKERGLHPTQKPLALFEYLIKTYTNELETVLDNCMGSGTTAIACMNTGRNFIGFEKDEKYYNIILDRIKRHTVQIKLFN